MLPQKIYQKYISLGISCMPCDDKKPVYRPIGKKDVEWKQFQKTLPTPKDVARFKGPQIACVCGKVSGGLTCIDFDIKNGDRFSDWMQLIQDTTPEVLSKLVYETTISGGYHVLFRTDVEVRNSKLANPFVNGEVGKAMIETRGEGGYFVCAPSSGYSWYYGSMQDITKLTASETETLLSAAKSFDETPKQEYREPKKNDYSGSGTSPFDDYDAKCNVPSLLQEHGWNIAFAKGDVVYFTRPGKKGKAVSASWNNVPDRFYCFTTSTCFDSEVIYKGSAVYTMLVHNGDYSAAAKDLYEKGFGDRVKKQDEKQEVKVVDPKDMVKDLVRVRDHGYPKGSTTGWGALDKYISIAKKQLTVVHGIPTHGKTTFTWNLATNMALSDGWVYVVFSPEDYPATISYHKLAELFLGKKLEHMTDHDLENAVGIIDSHFIFLDASEEDISLSTLLEKTKELKKTRKVDGLIIDPWNELELSRPMNISESDFIGVCLRRARKFARRNDISLLIVAHPYKIKKNKDGEEPVPTMYDISGTAHWYNKADNGICVYRNDNEKCTEIHVQKVKFRYFGKKGMCQLYFDIDTGRFSDGMNDEAIKNAWG